MFENDTKRKPDGTRMENFLPTAYHDEYKEFSNRLKSLSLYFSLYLSLSLSLSLSLYFSLYISLYIYIYRKERFEELLTQIPFRLFTR